MVEKAKMALSINTLGRCRIDAVPGGMTMHIGPSSSAFYIKTPREGCWYLSVNSLGKCRLDDDSGVAVVTYGRLCYGNGPIMVYYSDLRAPLPGDIFIQDHEILLWPAWRDSGSAEDARVFTLHGEERRMALPDPIQTLLMHIERP